MPKVPAFSAKNEHIDLRIDTTAPNETQGRQADLHIMLKKRPPETVHAERLLPARYQPACSARVYDAWKHKRPEDLQVATLLVHEARPDAWQQWFDSCELMPLFNHQLTSSDFYWLSSDLALNDNKDLKALWNWVVAEFSDTQEAEVATGELDSPVG